MNLQALYLLFPSSIYTRYEHILTSTGKVIEEMKDRLSTGSMRSLDINSKEDHWDLSAMALGER